jgi:23S rRNA pseudouridine1911/1915/1917 synthase
MLQRWIKHGWCTVDGRIAVSKQPVRPYQHIILHTPLPVQEEQGDFGALDILYHQDDILVLNKAPGQLPHQAGKILSGTLLNDIHDWCEKHGFDTAETRLVNRIDRDTSGIVLCSLNKDIHRALSISLQAHDLHKEYLAICCGVPELEHGHWRDPIAAGDPRTIARAIAANGQDSHTEYFVEAVSPGRHYALLKIKLHTGRQHQIRIHAAHNGVPLVGDWVYGSACRELDGQALHAARLHIPHPLRDEQIEISAPLPRPLQALWESLAAGARLTPKELSREQQSKLGLLDNDESSYWKKPSWLTDAEYTAMQIEYGEHL